MSGGCDVYAEKSKSIIRRLKEEIYNQDRLNPLDELAAQDVVKHFAFPEHRHGIEGFTHLNRWAHDLFPDAHYAVEARIAEGIMVAVRITFSGSRVLPRALDEIIDRAL
jgi:predicted ester cyclase